VEIFPYAIIKSIHRTNNENIGSKFRLYAEPKMSDLMNVKNEQKMKRHSKKKLPEVGNI